MKIFFSTTTVNGISSKYTYSLHRVDNALNVLVREETIFGAAGRDESIDETTELPIEMFRERNKHYPELIAALDEEVRRTTVNLA